MTNRPLFGPAGNSNSFLNEGYKHTYQAPAWLQSRGLDAYEYSAGNGVHGSLETFAKIGAEAKKHNIALSFHAPYYISLSGVEIEKRLKSIDYIQKSVDAAEAMQAEAVAVADDDDFAALVRDARAALLVLLHGHKHRYDMLVFGCLLPLGEHVMPLDLPNYRQTMDIFTLTLGNHAAALVDLLYFVEIFSAFDIFFFFHHVFLRTFSCL